MRARIKTCCIADVTEADMAIEAGADLLGLVGPMPTGPGTLTLEQARDIASGAAPWAQTVLLTSAEEPEEIASQVRKVGANMVQIVNHVSVAVHQRLDVLLPDVPRVQVIHVEGHEALEMIAVYAGYVVAFLLDSGRPSQAEFGGTGRVHDWSVSARFVTASPVPVFLAGGLTSRNVGEALALVRPFGLDLCSGIRTNENLDPVKLDAFMTAVRKAT